MRRILLALAVAARMAVMVARLATTMGLVWLLSEAAQFITSGQPDGEDPS